MALLPVTVIGWTLTTVALLRGETVPPLLSLVSLGVLIGGFEAIHALNVGVERIGRFLQVYYEYEGATDGPSWETTAMKIGPGLPGGGIDPLFTVVFAALTGLNLALTFPELHVIKTYVVVLPVHAIFWIRMIRARGAAARQRAVDLETFRAIKATQGEARTTP
jgi:hypothetical protein